MGTHRIEITMTGPHGCDRTANEGDALEARCGLIESCPDCAAAELVARLKDHGTVMDDATIAHSPGTPSEVVDDLVSGKRRKGSFA